MKIYTRTGDMGSTSLIGGERVGKDDFRIEAYGTVDELSAMIAFLRDSMDPNTAIFSEYRDDIRSVLNTLMDAEASLASSGTAGNKRSIGKANISLLESRIDYIGAMLRPVDKFTIPGGHPLVSLSHVCRTVCRRAERAAVRASRDFTVDPNVIAYLNRLSDYLYMLGRRLGEQLNITEGDWTPQ